MAEWPGNDKRSNQCNICNYQCTSHRLRQLFCCRIQFVRLRDQCSRHHHRSFSAINFIAANQSSRGCGLQLGICCPGQRHNTTRVSMAEQRRHDSWRHEQHLDFKPCVHKLYGQLCCGCFQSVRNCDQRGCNRIRLFAGSATFAVTSFSFPAPTLYQWIFNGTNLPGATSNTLTINNVRLPNTGAYQVQVGNGYSFTNSYIAALDISPSIVNAFSGETAIWGTSATISVGAVGNGTLTYQWYFNGVPIEGATLPSLNFSSIQFTNGGLYSVVVSSQYGSVTNIAEQVVVNPAGISLGFYPGLTISGVAGYSYIIQSSTNLANTNSWVTKTNLTLTLPMQLWIDTNVDASSPFNTKTFYQVLPGQ